MPSIVQAGALEAILVWSGRRSGDYQKTVKLYHAKHINSRGSGACPPENFEKLHPLRLNLRAFLMIFNPLVYLHIYILYQTAAYQHVKFM